jgi:hypothetical protein
MMSSAELKRKLTEVLERYGPGDSRLQLLITVSPDSLERLRIEDEKDLIEIEKRYGCRIHVRKNPNFDIEQFTIIDIASGEELASIGD